MKNYKAFVALLTMLTVFGCASMVSAQTRTTDTTNSPNAVPPQTTAFTYQGRLNDNSMQANGSYDFQFALYDAATGGTEQATAQTIAGVTVTNGVFTVQLDFTAAPFAAGANRFLEIRVKRTTDANYTTLNPRQQITSVPYTTRSLLAGAADTLSANCVGCVSNGQIGAVDGSKVTGSGSGLTNLNASNLTTGTVPLARLGTNTPTATTFLRGDNTFAPIPGGSGVTLQVSATKTNTQTTQVGSNFTPPENVSFNNVITSPTAGTFDGTTFTATTSGTYLVTASLGTFPAGSTSGAVNVVSTIAVNGTTVALTAGSAFNNSGSGGVAPTGSPTGRANISMILSLNAGDTVVIRAGSGSTVIGITFSTDGTTRLAIAKLN